MQLLRGALVPLDGFTPVHIQVALSGFSGLKEHVNLGGKDGGQERKGIGVVKIGLGLTFAQSTLNTPKVHKN